jgi:hypothetical protein
MLSSTILILHIVLHCYAQWIIPPPLDTDHVIELNGTHNIGQVFPLLWQVNWTNVSVLIDQDDAEYIQYLPDAGKTSSLVRATPKIPLADTSNRHREYYQQKLLQLDN